MPRLFNRPRGMPRFHQGRMFNRLTGQRAPRLYSGNRPRRASHAFFGTQVSPYGARGGGYGQAHAAHAGHAGNVYAAMLAQARRGQGTNMGALHHTPGYTGSRTFRGFRTGGAKAKQDAYKKFIGDKTRKDFGSYADWRRFRRQGKRVARQAKREFAQSYVNPFGTTHKRGRISVRQNPYTGRRVGQLVGFRGRSTDGTQNRFEKIRGRHEAATKRYNWGQKNPTMTGFRSGGLGYMSQRGFERAQGAVQEREGIRLQQREALKNRAERRAKRQQAQAELKLRAQQSLWRGQIGGLSVPRVTGHTFTPNDPMWDRYTVRKGWKDKTGRDRGGSSYWGYRNQPERRLDIAGGEKAKWQWNRPLGKIRTHQQSILSPYRPLSPFSVYEGRRDSKGNPLLNL